jgi:hypothetical protein
MPGQVCYMISSLLRLIPLTLCDMYLMQMSTEFNNKHSKYAKVLAEEIRVIANAPSLE